MEKRDTSGRGRFVVRVLPGKGRGLVASESLPAGSIVLGDSCVFLRNAASGMCVACRRSDHSTEQCSESGVAALAKRLSVAAVAHFAGKGLAEAMEIARDLTADASELARSEARKLWEAGGKEWQARVGGDRDAFERFFLVCETNCHAMDEGNMGLFPLVAMANHSCRPNCRFLSEPGKGQILLLKTTRKVAKDEELTISYVTPFLALALRQKVLQTRYGFLCSCDACDGKQPDRTRAFLCGVCDDVVLPVGRGDGVWSCCKCKRNASPKEIASFVAAEVYPSLHASIVTHAGKEPTAFLAWEKLASRTRLMSHRHWMMYFGQGNLMKQDPVGCLCRMISAHRHLQLGNLTEDMVSLLEMLVASHALLPSVVATDARKLLVLARLEVRTTLEREHLVDEFEALFAANLASFVASKAVFLY